SAPPCGRRLTCSRSGSWTQTVLPSATISCGYGSRYSQRNSRGADIATRPLDDSRTRPLSSNTCWVNWPSRPLSPRVKLSSWSRAPACAAPASATMAMSSQRLVRIMGRPRGWVAQVCKGQAEHALRHPVRVNAVRAPRRTRAATQDALHLPRRRRCQHGAVAVVLRGGHHSRRLHRLDQPRGAVVADLEPALHAGDRRAAGLGDDLDRLVVQRVGLVARTAACLGQAGGADRAAVV